VRLIIQLSGIGARLRLSRIRNARDRPPCLGCTLLTLSLAADATKRAPRWPGAVGPLIADTGTIPAARLHTVAGWDEMGALAVDRFVDRCAG
jgi:hypothetical protein